MVGVSVHPVDPHILTEQVASQLPQAVILDLNHRSIPALDIVRNLKSDTRTKGVLVLGFVSHVQTDLIAAAREAGCDMVLARSAFSQQLPQLLRRLAGLEPAGGTNL